MKNTPAMSNQSDGQCVTIMKQNEMGIQNETGTNGHVCVLGGINACYALTYTDWTDWK